MLFCVFCGVRSCSFCDVKQVRSRIFVFFGDMCKRGVITGKGKKRESIFLSVPFSCCERRMVSPFPDSGLRSPNHLFNLDMEFSKGRV